MIAVKSITFFLTILVLISSKSATASDHSPSFDILLEKYSAIYGRDHARALALESYSHANNKIRMDLFYATSGTSFGVQSETALYANEMDLNKALLLIIENSLPLTPLGYDIADKMLDEKPLKAYLRWKKIFASDGLLNFFKP